MYIERRIDKPSLGKKVTFKAICSECLKSTSHKVLCSVEVNIDVTYSDEGDGDEVCEIFEIVQCIGCDNVAFRKALYDLQDPSESLREDLFPRVLTDKKRIFDKGWYYQPGISEIASLYNEIYSGLANNLAVLPGAGMRILLERICLNAGAKGSNLSKKIDGLHALGFCSQNDIKILKKLVKFGNEVIHEKKPDKAELMAAFTVLEHLCSALYLMPHSARSLKDR